MGFRGRRLSRVVILTAVRWTTRPCAAGFAITRRGSFSQEVEADLVVIGTVGRTGIPGLIIGNTAENVLQTTSASVLAVKPSGFVSPVTLP